MRVKPDSTFPFIPLSLKTLRTLVPSLTQRRAHPLAALMLGAALLTLTPSTARPDENRTWPAPDSMHFAPDVMGMIALGQFRMEIEDQLEQITGLDSTFYQPFAGLRAGDRDARVRGAVHRLQKALLKWNEKLPLKANGHYDEATVKSMTLFKLVYDLDGDGTCVDNETAGYLLALDEGTIQYLHEPTTIVGRLLYSAAQYLGIRYRLGGDGNKSTDCGMLTRMAMIAAGYAENIFNRVAATQYHYAEKGEMGLTLLGANEEPAPGDLVFFKWRNRRAKFRYKGITHVGIYLNKVGDSIYVLEAYSRQERKVTILDRSHSLHTIVGYARISGPPPQENFPGIEKLGD